jgi:hypothetical protein
MTSTATDVTTAAELLTARHLINGTSSTANGPPGPAPSA